LLSSFLSKSLLGCPSVLCISELWNVKSICMLMMETVWSGGRHPVAVLIILTRHDVYIGDPRSFVQASCYCRSALPRRPARQRGPSPEPSSALFLLCYKRKMSASAQQSFRNQLSGFRWANSVQDDSAAAAPPQGVLGRAWGGLSGYIPLRSEGRSQEEEAYFALSVRSGDNPSS